MKKFTLTLIFLSAYSLIFAGGILTNSNQSARFIRMLSRDASTSVDAVYYNPAGLMMLDNGFYLSLSNQTIFQTKTIQNDFLFLNEHKYTGDVTVPAFPAFYSVYKMDKLAISFGLSPNAGGGTAKYNRGLPSFETQIALLPTMLTGMGIPTTAYSVDINFDGSSI
ncbi:MAG: aromatic hydrocarbon degradation protein, partial [Bacteroidales bacterium]|nr:aromatic hydrocarbon degradation protein [Bacteroidales bacterium]